MRSSISRTLTSFVYHQFATVRARKNLIQITNNAVERIKYLLAQQSNENILGVKIGVKTRGCNGLSYTMNYCEEKGRFDEIIEENGFQINSSFHIGVRVIVDSKAIMILVGTQMDYVEDEIKAEFVFRNPNEKVSPLSQFIFMQGSCGCGESFHI